MKKLKTILLYDKFYIIITLITLILSLSLTFIPTYKSKYNITDTSFSCKINDYKIDGDKLELGLKCDETLIGIYYINTEEEKNNIEKNIELGSKVNLVGELSSPTNNTVPYLFNYKKYLYNKKIYYILNINEIRDYKKSTNIFYKIKNSIIKRVNKIKNKEYIYAYILGNTDKLDPKILESYRLNGISHLFALSGLHVGVFSLILLKILNKLKIKEIKEYIIIFSFLLIFSFITGFSPSILRASLLFFLIGINKVCNLNIKTINILYLVFNILVLTNPFIIYNMSFILSFITTYFIILSNSLIKGKNYFISLLKVSLLSHIANIGLSIYYFNYINPLGIIFNLLFVPLVSFIIFPFTILTFIFSFLNPVLYYLTSIMENISLTFSKLSLPIYFPQIKIITVIIYYILLYIIIRYKKKKVILLLCILIALCKTKYLFNFTTRIYFIDVGQGDSILIVTPHNRSSIMIDTGGKIDYKKPEWKKRNKAYNISNDTLIPFMRKIGINKIDYLFLTHGDFDHAGETQNLIKNFKIDNIYINKGEENNIEKNIKNKRVLTDNYIEIDNIKLYSLNNKIFNDENDNSLVLYTKINNTKILFTGDASLKTEEFILKNYNLEEVDILKVAHHGSSTSSGIKFLEKIKPKISIVSSGKNNRYNHPNDSVVNRLKKYGTFYNTAENGTVEIVINKTYKIYNYSP